MLLRIQKHLMCSQRMGERPCGSYCFAIAVAGINQLLIADVSQITKCIESISD